MTLNDMTSAHCYEVKVTREDGLWVAVIGGVPGGATEAYELEDLDTEVRDLLGGLLDADGDRLWLHYDHPVPSRRIA